MVLVGYRDYVKIIKKNYFFQVEGTFTTPTSLPNFDYLYPYNTHVMGTNHGANIQRSRKAMFQATQNHCLSTPVNCAVKMLNNIRYLNKISRQKSKNNSCTQVN